MQQQNMRLKIGAFQIDMNDGEVLFVIHHINNTKERCIDNLAILWKLCHSTYNDCMDKIISAISTANPGVTVDTDTIREGDVLVKLLMAHLVKKEAAGGVKSKKGEGEKGEQGKGQEERGGPVPLERKNSKPSLSAEEAQLRLIRHLLELQQEFLSPPLQGPSAFTTNFRKDMDSFLLDPKEITFTIDKDTKKRVELGKGAFGVVYQGKIFHTIDVAIKQITYRGHSSYETFKQEARIMKQLINSNIVTFCGVAIIDNQLHIISEYCNQGSLTKYLEKNSVSVSKAISLAKEAATALNFLHYKNFIHRDVKPGNLLVHDGHLKLADFGLTTLIQNVKDAPAAGTLFYVAPEIFTDNPITNKVDVFAFGIVLWELLHPNTPLYPTVRGQQEYELTIARLGKRMNISNNLPKPLSQLIQDCWATDPEQRPTMVEVHSRLSEIDTLIQQQTKQEQQLPQTKGSQPQASTKGFFCTIQ
eukprot:Phypoly_transcript_06464.p1 GENE.Phypoly_transcript_06464~~Phypoly_transcript_06464.p1  ORF type:complete len:474 (-),score=78.83 Phypoly_transcript_06464:61-1482(-)